MDLIYYQSSLSPNDHLLYSLCRVWLIILSIPLKACLYMPRPTSSSHWHTSSTDHLSGSDWEEELGGGWRKRMEREENGERKKEKRWRKSVVKNEKRGR